MGLDTHIGREFPLAVSGAVVTDRTVQVLVAGVVAALAVASRAWVTALL
jgi:hypothetical protein